MIYQIDSDGRTAWVNDQTGCCIGRLAPSGIDVHKTGEDQMLDGTQCLDCAHDVPKAQMWDYFVQSMSKHHGVTVPESARPGWSKP